MMLTGRVIRHRALALQDTANAIVTAELNQDFERFCEEIKESRLKRGNGDCYYHVFPSHCVIYVFNYACYILPFPL